MSWKITAPSRPLPALAFSGMLFVATAALSLIGCGGGGSGSGGGGQSSTGGDGGTGGSVTGCATPADCPGMDTECQTRTCVAGACGVTNTPAGTPTANQIPGDCKVVSCDGNGVSTSEDDDTDILDDGSDCTNDTCDAGSPKNTPLAEGAPCGSGGSVCDGNGSCVECVDAAGCPSGVCEANVCLPDSCVDAVKNGSETDVDCGGAACPPCKDGEVCGVAADCESSVCDAMVCLAPVCSDAVKNGDETDIDCGGSCAPCGPDKGCAVDADCLGGQCSGTVCVPNCSDQSKNNNETDVDCGGPDCGGCDPGKVCVVGNDCASSICTGNVCQAPVCGDAVINGVEICDDGNVASGDGCAANCTVEPGYACMGSPSVCPTVCGDGLIKGAETCDDGNFLDNDGCSSTCAPEPGYACVGMPSICQAICGDGQVYGAETCDDGNLTSNDGCSSACQSEAGYSCAGQPSLCTSICGDGLIKGAETCDDGNLSNGDGCTSTCAVQPGYGCAGQPSVCVMVVCGDNVMGPGEQCDDGNVKSCDGCNAKCQLEAAVGPNLALAIPDDGYDGTIGSMACVNLPVTASGDGLVDSVCVQLGADHTWVGDMTVKVISPANTVVTVMSRTGAVEPTDDGTDVVVGDSSNMAKAFPVTFVDAGAKSAELMGNTIADAQIVCKDDLACVYDPVAGAATPGKLVSFAGQSAAGTWKVCVGDSAALDTGTIEFVRLGVVQ